MGSTHAASTHRPPMANACRHLRRLVTTVGSLAVVTVVAACGSSGGGASSGSTPSGSADAGKRVRVAMFLVATANTHQQAARKGAEATVQKDGNASLRVFGANFNPKTQISQVEAAAASGQYDALVINSVDGSVMAASIAKALAAKIKVVCGFSVCGPDQDKFGKQIPGVAAQVSSDYYAIGQGQADALGKGCADTNPCKTVYIDGVPTLAAEKAITNGFNQQIKQYPNVKIVAHGVGQYLAPPAYKSMKDVLQAHSDIDAVVSPGDQMIIGARQALDESPLKDKKVLLIGDGASTLAVKYMNRGKWYADAILRPYHEGVVETQAAIDAVRGKPVESLVNSSKAPGIGELYITQETVGKFTPEWPG
jgi:ABC-type sugar transport system substrate-binding protein